MMLRSFLMALIPSLCFEKLRCMTIGSEVGQPDAYILFVNLDPGTAECLREAITEAIDARREEGIEMARDYLEEKFNEEV